MFGTDKPWSKTAVLSVAANADEEIQAFRLYTKYPDCINHGLLIFISCKGINIRLQKLFKLIKLLE